MFRAALKSLLGRKVRLLMSTFAIVLGVAFVVGTDKTVAQRSLKLGRAMGDDRQVLSGLSSGDEVVLNPGINCGECEFCTTGWETLCEKQVNTGYGRDGSYAEYATAHEDKLARKPATLSFEQAAAFPLSHQTAWRMIVGRGAVRPGDTVLIHGVGGGVGTRQVARQFEK